MADSAPSTPASTQNTGEPGSQQRDVDYVDEAKASVESLLIQASNLLEQAGLRASEVASIRRKLADDAKVAAYRSLLAVSNRIVEAGRSNEITGMRGNFTMETKQIEQRYDRAVRFLEFEESLIVEALNDWRYKIASLGKKYQKVERLRGVAVVDRTIKRPRTAPQNEGDGDAQQQPEAPPTPTGQPRCRQSMRCKSIYAYLYVEIAGIALERSPWLIL